MTVKKYIGLAFKFALGIVVLAFLGLRSLDFFYFVTPPDEWYYAYLGFGLTGGGVIAYLIIFLWEADTELKKAVSIGMLLFCIAGELVTAGFGLRINAWRAGGFQMQNSDFESMILAIQLLGFFHAAALVLYVAGDPIREAFGDHDGDGTPNIIDPDYKPVKKPSKPFRLPWQKETVQNNADVGQLPLPQIRMDNWTREQLMELGKHAVEIEARNKAGQGSANGNGVNPTKAVP
jgi:hypothetical protein